MLLCKHNQFMSFLRWFLSRRSNADWTTWRSMIITLPCVVGLLFTAYDATHENSAAKRQQTSEGLVISYIRSNHSRCGYTFSVHGKQYSGTASAPTDHVTGRLLPNASPKSKLRVYPHRDDYCRSRLYVYFKDSIRTTQAPFHCPLKFDQNIPAPRCYSRG